MDLGHRANRAVEKLDLDGAPLTDDMEIRYDKTVGDDKTRSGSAALAIASHLPDRDEGRFRQFRELADLTGLEKVSRRVGFIFGQLCEGLGRFIREGIKPFFRVLRSGLRTEQKTTEEDGWEKAGATHTNSAEKTCLSMLTDTSRDARRIFHRNRP